MANFKLGSRILRKLVLPSAEALKKRLACAFFASFILNVSFLLGFKSFHENFWILGVLLFLNFLLANYLCLIQMQGVCAFSKSPRRLGLSQIVVFFSYLFPLYQLYLYSLFLYKDQKRSMSNADLVWKPIFVCASISLLALVAGAPAQNKFLKTQLSPELGYLEQVSVEAYKILKIKNSFEESCINSNDWQCIRKKLNAEIFPSTNTGIILSTAVDALVTFEKKRKMKDKAPIDQKEEAVFLAGENLLVSNVEFLKENKCRRLQPLDFIGPISLVTGPFTGYMVQFVDVLISEEYEYTASTKLTELSKKIIEQDKNKVRNRKIASLIPMLNNPGCAKD